MAALLAGQGVCEVAKAFKVSDATVSRILSKIPQEMFDREDAVRCRKLRSFIESEILATECRAVEHLLLRGWSLHRIASSTGISYNTVVFSYGHVYEQLVREGRISEQRIGSLTIDEIAKRKLRLYVSSQISQRLRKNDAGTETILQEFCGYSIEDLKAHLEIQFTDGMNWDNYGEWHVDHRRPASWFSFTSPSDLQFKECWSLNNLQPKWARDNTSKGNRFAD